MTAPVVIAHSAVDRAPPTVADVLGHWHWTAAAIGLVAVAALYALGLWRVRRWPAARAVAFGAGLLALAAALLSGVDAHAGRLLSVHMVQHLALALVAAPLLVAGAPLTLALRALRGKQRRRLARALGSRPARAIAHPAAAFAALPAAMAVTHLPPVYGYALAHGWAHAAEHALYLGAGALFWLPVLGAAPSARPLPGFSRVAYLLAAMPPMAAVGLVLNAQGAVLYDAYRAPAAALGISAVADQRAAAGVMIVAGTLIVGAVAFAVAWSAWSADERRERAQRAARPRLTSGGAAS